MTIKISFAATNLNSLFDFIVSPSGKTELRILTSEADLLTQFLKKIFLR